MTAAPFKFDEIGYWSELKLEIVEKYGSAYASTRPAQMSSLTEPAVFNIFVYDRAMRRTGM